MALSASSSLPPNTPESTRALSASILMRRLVLPPQLLSLSLLAPFSRETRFDADAAAAKAVWLGGHPDDLHAEAVQSRSVWGCVVLLASEALHALNMAAQRAPRRLTG